MKGQRIVVKIGGSILGEHDTTLEDLVWLGGQGFQPIVVHGGGKKITEWLERQGVPTRFVDGVRVTDDATIDVAVAVMAGLVNKQLVAAINALGGRALGLSGADAGILRARVKDPALGLVGEPTHVDGEALEGLLDKGYLPVISPIGVLDEGAGPTATLLNINADTLAAEIGGALKAEQFIFLTDVPGVCDTDGTVFPHLSPDLVRSHIASGVISGGMIPKVEADVSRMGGGPSRTMREGRRARVRQAAWGISRQTRGREGTPQREAMARDAGGICTRHPMRCWEQSRLCIDPFWTAQSHQAAERPSPLWSCPPSPC